MSGRRTLDLGMWRVHPTHPHLVWLYCEGCETYSRTVRKPTEADKRVVRERCGDPHAIVQPTPPRGWEHGCPRCDR